jgi:hypothetical protein
MDEKLELKDGSIWIMEDIKKTLQKVYDHYRDVCNTNDYLRKEIEKVKSDTYKDEELAKMKSEYDRMKEAYFRGFPISEEEHKKINEWIDEQMKKHPGIGGAIGGRFTYEFLPTGIGTAGTIIDGFTGDKFTFQELG